MNRGWKSDPWKVFTAIALGTLIFLVVFSQLWIFKSSLQRDGGAFALKTEKDTPGLIIEESAVKGFSLKEPSPGAGFSVLQKTEPLYQISGRAPGLLEIKSLTGESFAIVPAREGGFLLTAGSDRLWVNQKVFTSFLEDSPSPQELDPAGEGEGVIRLAYDPGAYLLFSDKDKRFTLGNYWHFMSRSKYMTAVKNSFIIMIMATAIGAVFGIGTAYLFARYKIPGTGVFLTVVTMASVSPPFLGAYAWRMLLGGSGIITRALGGDWSIVGMHGVIWVISWLVFPIIFLLTYDAFISLDDSLKECSMSLGGNRRRTFFKVELPLAMPGIITGLYMAMMTAFMDFGTPYVISLDLNVLPVLIYKEYMSEVGGSLSLASTGSILMILFSSVILTAQRFYLARRSYASVKAKRSSLRETGPLGKGGIMALGGLVLFFALIPHFTVMVSAFLKWRVGILTSEFTGGNFVRLFQTNLGSLGVTLFTGLSATLLSVVFGLGIAYVVVKKRYPFFSHGLNLLVMMPYLIPGTVLGLGFILIFNQPPFLLTGTWVILVLAYFVRKLPYAVKSAEAALYQVHRALEEAAGSLGAGNLRSFYQITLPLIMGGVISGGTLSFLQIMTEISSTIILYRPPWKPMTAVIFENTIDAGADFGVASAMTVLLMFMLYVPLYFVTVKARQPKEVSFESI